MAHVSIPPPDGHGREVRIGNLNFTSEAEELINATSAYRCIGRRTRSR